MSFLKSKSRLFIANIEHYINFDWYKYKLELYNQIQYIKLKKAFKFSYHIELISWLYATRPRSFDIFRKNWLLCWNSWKNNDRRPNKSLIIHKTYNMHFKTPSRRQYDMHMCNYHDYYKNNSPKNRY
jgi:hypothetical protein